jgi:hypothetical protein
MAASVAGFHRSSAIFLRFIPRNATLQLMSTLTEIESAADGLSAEQKQELILFLAARLRKETAELPSPREISQEQIAQWIADDEGGFRRFLARQ